MGVSTDSHSRGNETPRKLQTGAEGEQLWKEGLILLAQTKELPPGRWYATVIPDWLRRNTRSGRNPKSTLILKGNSNVAGKPSCPHGYSWWPCSGIFNDTFLKQVPWWCLSVPSMYRSKPFKCRFPWRIYYAFSWKPFRQHWQVDIVFAEWGLFGPYQGSWDWGLFYVSPRPAIKVSIWAESSLVPHYPVAQAGKKGAKTCISSTWGRSSW